MWNDSLITNIIEPYVKKGTKVHIEGELETAKFTDSDGIERQQTKVVLQGFDGKLQIVQMPKEEESSQEQTTKPQGIEDDIPF